LWHGFSAIRDCVEGWVVLIQKLAGLAAIRRLEKSVQNADREDLHTFFSGF